MLEIKWAKSVKKDLKKYKHQKDIIYALQEVILLLVNKGLYRQ
jgi:mRNA-degrading endonuclease YafQ of YafQ-DinJ toxin-antitoxin module